MYLLKYPLGVVIARATDVAAPTEPGSMSMVSMLVSMALIFGVMYFMMIRPQRKKDKVQREMRSKIEVGDEIITVGGIVGRVVSLREDTLVIETGSDRSKIRIQRWAIHSNNTVHDDTPSA